MTVQEYNQKWYKLYNNAQVVFHAYKHSLSKCNDYEGAIKQLEIIGLNDELVQYLKDAVECYNMQKKNEIVPYKCFDT